MPNGIRTPPDPAAARHLTTIEPWLADFEHIRLLAECSL
jgi:hypothetical protein